MLRQDKAAKHAIELANGAGIECGCCFGEEVMVSRIGLALPSLFCGDHDHGNDVAMMWLVWDGSVSRTPAMVPIPITISATCHLADKC